ncbi:hypothetical protein predicted by Glimmer/Critica (plasmid) [Acetobacter ghanensis]|uniref:Uncharacterized protein n=1 Tax=Acetobacter ghanensis TaxID=431306 RepID=A0A0U5F6Z3_9PROT|nr:hypothetical protein predicted by Glimmer/Critica [Acetobacter ghanensis]
MGRPSDGYRHFRPFRLLIDSIRKYRLKSTFDA